MMASRPCLSHRRVMARLEDTTAVLFGLANGMSATLCCSLVTAVSARFAVFGTKGCAELALRSSGSASLQRPRGRALDTTQRPPSR